MFDNQIAAIIRSIKNYDQVEIVPETRLIDNLGFTSLDVMNLVLALERRFNITFQDQHLDLDCFLSFGSVLNTLTNYQLENH